MPEYASDHRQGISKEEVQACLTGAVQAMGQQLLRVGAGLTSVLGAAADLCMAPSRLHEAATRARTEKQIVDAVEARKQQPLGAIASFEDSLPQVAPVAAAQVAATGCSGNW